MLKYLSKHVHIDSVISQEDCDYINLVLGKYQYTETGMANLEDEFTWKFFWYFKENYLCREVCTM